jgi:hypothetical protein
MPFRHGHLIAIGSEPRSNRGERRAEPLAAAFEERVDRAAATQKQRLLLCMRHFGLFQMELALGDKMGRSGGIMVLAIGSGTRLQASSRLRTRSNRSE